MSRFSVRARVDSFRYAIRGIGTMLREQHNTRIHLLATVMVAGLAWYLQLASHDCLLLLIAVALVWLAEAMNSALEYLSDAAVPEQNDLIKKAKDVAAAGVLISALVAVAIGLMVFLPYL